MELAGKECLPSIFPGKAKSKGIPGWNTYVKPYSDESRFWHGLWAAAGKPLAGELFTIMKVKKHQYKYAVRRLKRCIDILKNDKLIESLLDEDKCIFDEVRKLRKKRKCLSSRIDGNVGSSLIANHFSNLYTKLFNNVENEDSAHKDLIQSIQANIGQSSMNMVEQIDIKTVKDAVLNMKPNKRDSVFDVTSDMYQKSPDIFFEHLTTILQQSLIHGFLPPVVLLCTLVPLVKDSLGDITKSNNYRAIAGGCLILKIIDLVVLEKEGSKLSTDALQFAYKTNTGTATCTWAVTTVVEYFTRGGKPVFSAAMDMSKAFDMVKWSGLFCNLLRKRVHPMFLK